jgi:putative NADH-flavin reductase
MKVMIAAAAGWIGFCLADEALYGGHHVRLVGGLFNAIGAGFGIYL